MEAINLQMLLSGRELTTYQKALANNEFKQLQTELKEAKERIDTLNKELKQRIETDKNF